jgi:hypothetical protein
MQFRLVLLGANPFPANVSILTPAAAGKPFPVAHAPADGTSFQHARDDVPGVTSPSIQHLAFFADLFEFLVA